MNLSFATIHLRLTQHKTYEQENNRYSQYLLVSVQL